MKKNKIMVISIIIAVAVIIGVIGILYVKTDLFKSDETLFYKYLLKAEMIGPQTAEVYQQLAQNSANSNYSKAGTVNCSMASNDNATNIANIQNLFSIKYNTLKNKNLDQLYADYTLSSDNQDIITFRFLKDGNTYALKAENVVTKYLALENNNLKDFFTKLGVEDTSNIPNNLPEVSIEDLTSIEPELLNNIKSTYFTIITDHLERDHFVRITNADKTTTIELSLSEQEIADMGKNILETLKNDDETINFIISKASLMGYDLNIDSLKTSIQEEIDKITDTTFSTEKGYFNLAVTENGKETTALELRITKNNTTGENAQAIYKIDLSESNKITIYANDGKETNIKAVVTFGYETNSFLQNVEILNINEDNSETRIMKMQYQINNYDSNNIEQNIEMEMASEEDSSTIQINVSSETQLKEDVEIEKITDQNATILNNLTSEQLSNLIYAIAMRIQYLYGDQAALLTTVSL